MHFLKALDAEIHHACADQCHVTFGRANPDKIAPHLKDFASHFQLWSDQPGWDLFFAELERMYGPKDAAKLASHKMRSYGMQSGSQPHRVGIYRGVDCFRASTRRAVVGVLHDEMGSINLAMGDKLIVAIPLYIPKLDDDNGLEERRYARKLGVN